MTAITYTDIVKTGILKQLARNGEVFTIKIKGEADLLVTPQTSQNKEKKLIKLNQKLTIPDNFKTDEIDFSNYDLGAIPALRPAEDGATYASISPSFEHYFQSDSNKN